jgi:hypothetical protein
MASIARCRLDCSKWKSLQSDRRCCQGLLDSCLVESASVALQVTAHSILPYVVETVRTRHFGSGCRILCPNLWLPDLISVWIRVRIHFCSVLVLLFRMFLVQVIVVLPLVILTDSVIVSGYRLILVNTVTVQWSAPVSVHGSSLRLDNRSDVV